MLIENMTKTQLLSAMEKQNKITSDFCQQVIDAGRGSETMSTIRTKQDKLSLAYVEAMNLDSELSYEHSRRMAHHGKLSPIKRDL